MNLEWLEGGELPEQLETVALLVILDLLVPLDYLETLAHLVRQGRLVLLEWQGPLATQVFQV